MPEASLCPVTRANWKQALALAVAPEQRHFVAAVDPPVAIALAKAYIRPNNVPIWPLAVYADDTMVGFLNLSFEPGSQERYWISHFLIDRRHQRRGYGTAAMRAVVALLHAEHPACRALYLTVHPDNTGAQRLYRALGFEETGELSEGDLTFRLAVR